MNALHRYALMQITACLGVLGLWRYGLLSYLWEADSSGIVYGIVALLIWGLWSGFRMARRQVHGWTPAGPADVMGRLSDTCIWLGLIGTVIGFVQALSGVAVVHDTQALSAMIAGLVDGMGTALSTTLAGSVCGLWLRVSRWAL